MELKRGPYRPDFEISSTELDQRERRGLRQDILLAVGSFLVGAAASVAIQLWVGR